MKNDNKRETGIDKLSSKSIGEEYNNLTDEQKDEYKFIADEQNKLRDENCREL